MKIQKIAAFAYNNTGGNPAGVVLCDALPAEESMLRIASEVGYSETAFLEQVPDGWRVRYFAPEREVPFCGHATIASGAALGSHTGEGEYRLILNQAEVLIGVELSGDNIFSVALQSPGTWSDPAPQNLIDETLDSFHLAQFDLNPKYPVRVAFAGAKHLILVLNDRKTLARMNYEFDRMKLLMLEQDWITVSLLYQESEHIFHSRNAFAYGGVIEDPATGAAAAALAGYLRDIDWGGGNNFEVLQGFDMGIPSRLLVNFSGIKGEGATVSGDTRNIE